MAGLQDSVSDAHVPRRLKAPARVDPLPSSEIGSELDLDERSIVGTARCTWDQLIPHAGGSLTLLHSGRSAIRSALRAIASVRSGRLRFLLPSYLCPAVLQPFHDVGVEYDFYPVTEDLRTDWDQVRCLVASGGYTGLLFIRYFGSTAQDVPPIDLSPKGRTFYVIEDLAQAMLSPGAGNRGDYVAYSLRKFFGLPDGGAVVARKGPAVPAVSEHTDEFFRLRLMAFRARHLFRCKGLATRELYLEKFRQAELALDSSSADVPMSGLSRMLMTGEDPKRVRERRRQNFAYLRENWPEQPKVVPLSIAWRASDVPLGFPVWARDRDALQQALIARKIFPPVHWHLPEAARTDERCRAAWRLSEHILTIPCDQRYGVDDMKRVVRAVREILN